MLLLWLVLLYNGLALLGLWLLARTFLRGRDLSRYDEPVGTCPAGRDRPSEEHARVLEMVEKMRRDTRAAPFGQRLAAARRLADQGFAGTPNDPLELGVERREVRADGVPGEWILAPGADPARRLLYIHGGALVLGSPASHRALTSELSRRAGVAVLAIDYRLLPEHARLAPLEDCRRAWRWMAANGPEGPADAEDLYVAGDSAGGNLTLVLLQWIRDAGAPQARAAIAFSPATDNTFQSPSLRTNRASDTMLGPTLGRLLALPRWMLAWFTLASTRHRPQNPLLSPALGRLGSLPPTLVQASDSEMLHDDGQRYVNRAREAGSSAEFQIWPGMVHVWPLFVHVLPESAEALDAAAAFLERNRAAS